MSAPHAVLDVVARTLGELRALTATRDLPPLMSVQVRMSDPDSDIHLSVQDSGAAPLLACCEALGVESGRCLPAGEFFPKWATAVCEGGSLGGLAARPTGAVPSDAGLGCGWTVAQLTELVSGGARRACPECGRPVELVGTFGLAMTGAACTAPDECGWSGTEDETTDPRPGADGRGGERP